MGSVSSGNGFDRAAYEKEWANAEARLKLSSDDKAFWDTCKYTVRPFVYFDKILIVWSALKGQPQIKDILAVTSVDGSFQDGLWVRMRSKVTQQEFVVNHTPRKLPGLDIFAWVPFFNELRYVSASWDDPMAPRNLRLSVCFKMRHKPDDMLVENEVYLSELHVFRDRFPQYANTRF